MGTIVSAPSFFPLVDAVYIYYYTYILGTPSLTWLLSRFSTTGCLESIQKPADSHFTRMPFGLQTPFVVWLFLKTNSPSAFIGLLPMHRFNAVMCNPKVYL